MRNALVALNVAISIALYWPTWRRILARKSTGDFSKAAQWMILSMQGINFALAWLANAPHLVAIYIIQAVLVSVTIGLIYRYYEGEEK